MTNAKKEAPALDENGHASVFKLEVGADGKPGKIREIKVAPKNRAHWLDHLGAFETKAQAEDQSAALLKKWKWNQEREAHQAQLAEKAKKEAEAKEKPKAVSAKKPEGTTTSS